MNPSDITFFTGLQSRPPLPLNRCVVTFEGRFLRIDQSENACHLVLHPSGCFDLGECAKNVDQLHLLGLASEYSIVHVGDKCVLTSRMGGVVQFLGEQGPEHIVFEDGRVEMASLWRNVCASAAFAMLLGEPGATDNASVAAHVRPCRPELVASQSAIRQMSEGALLTVAAAECTETVYDTAFLEPIRLEGSFTDYEITEHAGGLSLARIWSDHAETSYVPTGAALAFDDRRVYVDSLLRVLALPNHAEADGANDHMWDDESPRVTAVALSMEPAPPVPWTPSAFASLAAAPEAGELSVGQVIEANVSLSQSVQVKRGTPELQLRIGGKQRVAHFSRSSGSDTLRFVYVVTDDDLCPIDGAIAGSAKKTSSLVDVEVSSVTSDGVELLTA